MFGTEFSLADLNIVLAMNITLLSDTHGHIDARILRHVEGSDEVWHAGDIGTLHVTDALSEVAPCRAVFGNIDDDIARGRTLNTRTLLLEG